MSVSNKKIDEQAMNRVESDSAVRVDSGIALRLVLLFLLAVTLIATLHWAMNVTNANARQIVNNLHKLRQKMEENARMGRTPAADREDGGASKPGRESAIGPTLGPATNP